MTGCFLPSFRDAQRRFLQISNFLRAIVFSRRALDCSAELHAGIADVNVRVVRVDLSDDAPCSLSAAADDKDVELVALEFAENGSTKTDRKIGCCNTDSTSARVAHGTARSSHLQPPRNFDNGNTHLQ